MPYCADYHVPIRKVECLLGHRECESILFALQTFFAFRDQFVLSICTFAFLPIMCRYLYILLQLFFSVPYVLEDSLTCLYSSAILIIRSEEETRNLKRYGQVMRSLCFEKDIWRTYVLNNINVKWSCLSSGHMTARVGNTQLSNALSRKFDEKIS